MESMIVLGLELVGIIAFAVSGAATAAEKGLDIFGVVFIGVINALGGGVIRDILLGIFPPIMFTYKVYAIVSIGSSLFVFLFAYNDTDRFLGNLENIDNFVNIFDAIGLGIFSVTSIQRCINFGYVDNAFLCILMSMTTGIGGGIMRDLLCQKLPAVLRKRIYALAAIAGGAIYYYMFKLNINHSLAMFCGMISTFIIRLLATKYKWNMPRIKKQ